MLLRCHAAGIGINDVLDALPIDIFSTLYFAGSSWGEVLAISKINFCRFYFAWVVARAAIQQLVLGRIKRRSAFSRIETTLVNA